DSRSVDLAARAWSLPEKGRYAVIVQAAVGAAQAKHPGLPSVVGGIRMLWRPRPECWIGIAVLGDAEVPTLADALPAAGWRVGMSMAVDGLANLARGRQLAELALRTITTGQGIACFQKRMTSALLASRPDLASELSGYLLAPLLDLDR